ATDADGPPLDEAPALEPASPSASAARAALAQRLAALRIEEVHLRDVDGDRHGLGQTQLHVRGELGDEVGARRDHALAAALDDLDLLVLLSLADGEGVDVE